MRNGAETLRMFVKEWKKYKFLIENNAGEVQQEIVVPAALDKKHAWHLGLAKAMKEGHGALLQSCSTTRVEEIVKNSIAS